VKRDFRRQLRRKIDGRRAGVEPGQAVPVVVAGDHPHTAGENQFALEENAVEDRSHPVVRAEEAVAAFGQVGERGEGIAENLFQFSNFNLFEVLPRLAAGEHQRPAAVALRLLKKTVDAGGVTGIAAGHADRAQPGTAVAGQVGGGDPPRLPVAAQDGAR